MIDWLFTLQLPINGYTELALQQFRMDMIESIVDRSEVTQEQENEDDEEVKETNVLETATPVLTTEVLSAEKGLETTALGPGIHLHEDEESDDSSHLLWKRQKLTEDPQDSPLSGRPPSLVTIRSPSMSPGYSPPLCTPPSGQYKSPSPNFQVSRSPSPQNKTESSSPQKKTESSPVHEAAEPQPQKETERSPVDTSTVASPQQKSPERSQRIDESDIENLLNKYLDIV